MTQLLILNGNILSSNKIEMLSDSIKTEDIIYPLHTIEGYQIIDTNLPADFSYQTYMWDGSKLIPKPIIIQKIVPQSVSPRQIRQALTRTGLRASVESAITAGDQDTKDWYNCATEFLRDNPHVITMGIALNVSPDQLDDLWMLASSL